MNYKRRHILKYQASYGLTAKEAEELYECQMEKRARNIERNAKALADKIAYSETLERNVTIPE